LGEKLAKRAIELDLLGYGKRDFREQVTLRDSRVDFVIGDGDEDGESAHVVEVKNVVCADYRAASTPEQRNDNHCVVSKDQVREEERSDE